MNKEWLLLPKLVARVLLLFVRAGIIDGTGDDGDEPGFNNQTVVPNTP